MIQVNDDTMTVQEMMEGFSLGIIITWNKQY